MIVNKVTKYLSKLFCFFCIFINFELDASNFNARFKHIKEKRNKTQLKVFEKGNTITWDISLLSVLFTVCAQSILFLIVADKITLYITRNI